jgi:hypothetical protein
MAPAIEQTDNLQNAYRGTYGVYATRLNDLQRLHDSGVRDAAAIEAAVLELENARVAHNHARDLLARSLSTAAPERVHDAWFAPEGESEERRIRNVAQLLWDLAGRPDGTAERDWYRAERLVESSTWAGR